jgi:phosphatidylglycerophosphate synthase
MSETDSQKHERINDILLGPIERRALRWLCERMPAWVTPDLLTVLALAAGVLIALSYVLTNISPAYLWLANFGFILHWFGDSLDGTLARYRKIERPKYGYFVDHSLDSLTEFLIAFGIGLSPYVQLEYALFALTGYLLMSVSVYVRTYVTGVFQISYGKFGPTEIRVMIILANTLVYFIGNPKLGTPLSAFTLFDLVAIGVGTVLILLFVLTTFRVAKGLRNQEMIHS